MTGGEALGALLAHQGGWDEMLLVATPIAIFAGLLWLANRRANRVVAARQAEARSGDDDASNDASNDDASSEGDA